MPCFGLGQFSQQVIQEKNDTERKQSPRRGWARLEPPPVCFNLSHTRPVHQHRTIPASSPIPTPSPTPASRFIPTSQSQPSPSYPVANATPAAVQQHPQQKRDKPSSPLSIVDPPPTFPAPHKPVQDSSRPMIRERHLCTPRVHDASVIYAHIHTQLKSVVSFFNVLVLKNYLKHGYLFNGLLKTRRALRKLTDQLHNLRTLRVLFL